MIEVFTKFIGDHPIITVIVLGLLVFGYNWMRGDGEGEEDD